MSEVVQTEKKGNERGDVGFLVIGGLLLAADIIMIVLFLVFSVASSLGISNYLTSIVKAIRGF